MVEVASAFTRKVPFKLSCHRRHNQKVYPEAGSTKVVSRKSCLGDEAIPPLTGDSEGLNARTFKYQITNTNNNTATACLNQCAAFGYGAGGLEYGDECCEYAESRLSSADSSGCGDAGNIGVVGATVAPETQCNVPCSGNSQYMCGGGSRLSWYAWSGTTPLYNWAYPTGNAAGQYQQFIGGVCIPLIITTGVNGKITVSDVEIVLIVPY